MLGLPPMKSAAFSKPIVLNAIVLGLVALTGCGQSKDSKKKTVDTIRTTETGGNRKNHTKGEPSAPVAVEVTFEKAEIFDRPFLYGSDLQYSAINDSEYELTLQSMSVGHVPATFRVQGDELQLIADNSINFESDVNHPGRLIHAFKIVSQNDTQITVAITRASPLLVTVLNGGTSPEARTSWLRSVKYVADGNYLMFESSIEGPDGSIAEFMESVFPRDTLVPTAAVPLLRDTSLEPWAERFRFLGAGPVYMNIDGIGRVQTEAAVRFLPPQPGKPIEWYVTPNIPEDFMAQIQTGIEGWNRYSRAMWGSDRDLVKFAGVLPSDVSLGDPRYNVINWDSVAYAGAAYESQAADPLTGIQSHSLIYLPYAWFNIGVDYWDKGGLSEERSNATDRIAKSIKARSFMGRPLSVPCLESPEAAIGLEARQDPEAFSRELLKGVLFHEMGHAMGLAHNFKGSLSYDPDNRGSAFSTSIMDYNQYSIERDAYANVESSDGPLLEYDRQIISLLYNEGRDIRDSDPVVPACDDDETDSLENGVDPLCIRYDASFDPTTNLSRTIDLLTTPTAVLGKTMSLPQALLGVTAGLPDASAIDTEAALKEAMVDLRNRVTGVTGFYLVSGAQSLNYAARAALRHLYVFQPDSLPDMYNEDAMRTRSLSGLNYVATLNRLPEAATASIAAVREAARALAASSAYVTGLDATAQAAALEKALTVLDRGILSIDQTRDSMLSKLRARVLGSIARVSTSPFYMRGATATVGALDVEAVTRSLLMVGLTSQVNAERRPLAERAAYANALMTYAGTRQGDLAITQIREAIRLEEQASANARAREESRALIAILTP